MEEVLKLEQLTQDFDEEFYEDDYDLNTSCNIIKQMIKDNDIKLKDIKQMYIKEWLSNDNFYKDIREGDVFIITKKELKEVIK